MKKPNKRKNVKTVWPYRWPLQYTIY